MPETLRLDPQRAGDLDRAAALLRGGGTVAFPTETVYGLGANALNASAVAKIFEAKERPAWDPLIVHIASAEELPDITAIDTPLRAVVYRLAEEFWPGPLTLLLPRTSVIPKIVTAGRPLVGVRVPGHPVALELIRRARVPIAAPSANRFGHTSPTSMSHVLADLDGRIDAVLDAGPSFVGVESTVLDPANMVIYRPGAVTQAEIERLCGAVVTIYTPPRELGKDMAMPSPGVGIRHYAPRAKVVLTQGSRQALLHGLESAVGEKTGVMLPEGWEIHALDPKPEVYVWGRWDRQEQLAARLFAGLRELDERGVDRILCPLPPGGGLGQAIRDRLDKAARDA